MQHSSSGNDDTSLSLVPTGRDKVELPKIFVRYLAFTKHLHVILFTRVISNTSICRLINTIHEKKQNDSC